MNDLGSDSWYVQSQLHTLVILIKGSALTLHLLCFYARETIFGHVFSLALFLLVFPLFCLFSFLYFCGGRGGRIGSCVIQVCLELSWS